MLNKKNIIKSRFLSTDDPTFPKEAIHIFAENKPASCHNQGMLNQLNSPFYRIEALDEIPNNLTVSDINRALSKKQSETGGLGKILELKVGARVMLTSNIDIEDRLINGQIGTVRHITINNATQVEKIYIEFDDEKAGHKLMNNLRNIFRQRNWVPIERIEINIKIHSNKDSSPVIKRTQFPLMLSWGVTIHKVQGLSLSKAVISFDLERQTSFKCGQIYVALSRVTSLDGLFLIGQYKPKAIKADPKASKEYERLRKESQFLSVPAFSLLTEKTFSLTLLNTRSLNKHAIDVAADNVFLESDVICFTESQLLPDQDTTHIENTLNDFNMTYNSSTFKYESLAFAIKSQLSVLNHEFSQGVSLLKVEKHTFLSSPITIALLYRRQSWAIPSFLDALSQLLLCYDIDVIIGDFNINGLGTCDNLMNVLCNYKLLTPTATHLSGSLLDYIFIKKQILNENFNVDIIVHPVHFSDHDAVKLLWDSRNTEGPL